MTNLPIGLSPRTMQYLNSVQNLEFSLSSWFPHRLESEDHTIPWFCPKLRILLSSWFPHRFEFENHTIPWFCPKLRILLSSWFPHRFESEDYTIPWFYPKLRIFFKFGGISPSAKMWDVDLTLEAPRTVRATDASKRSP